jgi:hypothetical protein
MDTSEWRIGTILKVFVPNQKPHYERVIQIEPEIITEEMPENSCDDYSTQGLSENWKYEVVPTFKIVQSLKKVSRISDAHCICTYDQYGGAVNPKCLIHGNG